jgi:carboxypeptidase Q
MRGRLWVGLIVGAGLAVSTLALAAEKEKESAIARNPELQRIVSTAREGSQVMEHLDVLCNRIGPRLTGSDNLTNACEWTRQRFAEFGIENARLEAWGEFPVGFDRGPWFGRVVEPESKALEFNTMAWSAGTKGVVRGKAVLAPRNQKELDEAKANGTLAGAWVIMPPPPPGGPGGGRFGGGRQAGTPKADTPKKEIAKTETPKADTPKSAEPRPDPSFTRKLRRELEAAKVAGLVGASQRELLVTGGAHRISWDKLPSMPSVTLLRKPYDEIVGWLKAGKPVTLEFDIRNYFKKGPIKLYNVIADIPGTEKPDEYVIVGGHIDSWDGATGATDNGTGVATTLEAAHILMKSGVRPKRTIRFMLWSGEEQGLLGSAAYVKSHKDLMPRISAVLVHDGGTNYLSGIGGTEAMLADFEKVFTPIKELDPKYPFEIRKVDGLRGGGSDHASFLSANVPGFFWGQRGGTAVYQHTHHTQFDTYDAAIPEYQTHSSLVVALGAYGIANLDHLLSREKLRAAGGGMGMGNRRTLGVQLDELTVSEVLDEGVAQKGGMKEGDEILKVDGTKLGDADELRSALQAGGPKKVVTVLRNGKELELKLDWEPAATPR